MKRNKFLYLLAGAFAISTGCQKVLDVKETDFIGGDVAYKTVSNCEQGVVGSYAALSIEMPVLLNATFADEVRVADFYNAATTHEWQYAPADVGLRDNFTAFNLYYRVIDRANRVLAALPNAAASTTSAAATAADEALRLKLKGEALFLRAYSHFELYRFYSNSAVGTDLAMAYMESPSLSSFPRINVSTYMQKLKADLAAAKPLLPTALTDISRATAAAVSGMQARVALYLKEYNDAITFSTEYINAVPLASLANFPGIWTDANNAEQAFQIVRTTSTSRMGSLFRGISASAANIGTITWRPSDKLWDSYDKVNDIRFAAYFKDEPLLAGGARSSTRLINKYAGTAYGTSAENVANQKVMRTAEMYLIRSEAKAETGDLAGAANDLNALRAVRINGYAAQTFATKADLIDAILTERYKELAYEGHRFWDLKRRNLPVTRLAVDAPNAAAQTLAAGNYRFLLPIPDPEIKANPQIQQNPGYN